MTISRLETTDEQRMRVLRDALRRMNVAAREARLRAGTSIALGAGGGTAIYFLMQNVLQIHKPSWATMAHVGISFGEFIAGGVGSALSFQEAMRFPRPFREYMHNRSVKRAILDESRQLTHLIRDSEYNVVSMHTEGHGKRIKR